MPVKCPVCETENAESASECVTCGKALAVDAVVFEDVPTIAGLEQTLHDASGSAAAPVPLLPELERTQVASRDLRVAPEVVPGVERTPLEQDPDVPLAWFPGTVDLDRGRAADDGERTPAPEDTGMCPWCGEPSAGAVCDGCGRRRSRYSSLAPAAAGQLASDDTVTCPACFGRVADGPRCTECGLPFPLTEVL